MNTRPLHRPPSRHGGTHEIVSCTAALGAAALRHCGTAARRRVTHRTSHVTTVPSRVSLEIRLRQRAVDLDDVLGHVHELVHEPLPVHLGQDAALVVVAQRAAHRLVVHVGLVLVQPPEPRHRLRVHQLEHALLAVRPLDEARAVLPVLQQLEQELPEVRGGALAALALHAGRGRRVGARPLLGLELVVVVMPLVVAEVEHRVGELVVRERRRRRSGEVVRAAAPAAVPVAVRVALIHAAHWKQNDVHSLLEPSINEYTLNLVAIFTFNMLYSRSLKGFLTLHCEFCT